jgi:putative peptide zinc metalloprotease protein
MHSGGGRPSGGPRRPLPGDDAVPGPGLAAGPDPGWIADYYRRLRRAAVVPADAAADREVLYLRTWAAGPLVARLALPAGRGTTAVTADQPGPGQAAPAVPRLAAGVEPIGEYQGSGLAEATYLVRNAAGQVVHLSRLLYLVVSAIDGRRTVGEVAEQVTAGFGRTVSTGNIGYLLANKLLPLGLLAVADPAAAGTPGKDAALLTLRLRRTVVPEAGVQILARLFRPLFRPAAVALVLTALTASDAWLFGSGRVGSASRYVLLHPLLLLLVLGLSVASMLFHECGHAAACRYGGARPGVIGMGIYLIWPAFFTNVTDAYRLGRAGRIRTDLGGVYFNAVFVLLLTGTYLATGYAPLAAAVTFIHLEIIQQLMPSLRLDGYFILADLIGVPDLFRRIGPTLRSLMPGRPADPALRQLKRSARISVTIWVLLVVPVLILQLGFVILDGPRLGRAFASSLLAQLQAAATEFGHTEIAAGLLTVISTVLLVLPMAGLSYVVLRTAQSAFRQVRTATRRRPALRFPAVAVALLLAAGLAAHWRILPVRLGGAAPRPAAASRVTAGRPPSGSPAEAGRPHPAPLVTARPAGAPARPPRAPAVVLQPVRAAGFDVLEGPQEDPGDENSATAPEAIDGNPGTAWSTQYYLGSPAFGGLKTGTGLILDMGRPVRISSVTVTFGPEPGADVSLEVGSQDTLAAATLATFRTVARASDVGGTRTFRAADPVRGRYVLIWFTKLPPSGAGRFAAQIFNIVVWGPG